MVQAVLRHTFKAGDCQQRLSLVCPTCCTSWVEAGFVWGVECVDTCGKAGCVCVEFRVWSVSVLTLVAQQAGCGCLLPWTHSCTSPTAAGAHTALLECAADRVHCWTGGGVCVDACAGAAHIGPHPTAAAGAGVSPAALRRGLLGLRLC